MPFIAVRTFVSQVGANINAALDRECHRTSASTQDKPRNHSSVSNCWVTSIAFIAAPGGSGFEQVGCDPVFQSHEVHLRSAHLFKSPDEKDLAKPFFVFSKKYQVLPEISNPKARTIRHGTTIGQNLFCVLISGHQGDALFAVL